MSYWGWKPYVSVAERRKKAEKTAARAKKAGAALSPIAPYRGAVAKTFWGKAWCDNLERYSDYANRLPRGRSYVRNGSVIDLQIAAGAVQAQVMGSSLYTVEVTVAEVPAGQWQAIGADCAGSIDSLVELLQGKLSRGVMERICKPATGLFPAPKEIRFNCSCPDWASMCKHVAAVLYGVGARLDQQPELLFGLRKVDAKDLVARAGSGLPKKGKASARVLEDAALADVFGIELAEDAPPAAAKRRSKTAAATTKAAKQSSPGKSKTAVKTPTLKPAKTAAPAKAKAGTRKPAAKTAAAKTRKATSAKASTPRAAAKRTKDR